MSKTKWSKIQDWCKRNWWILILICIALIAVVLVLFEIENGITKLKELGELANVLLTPICLMLGLVLGYPLLKRKLVDGYITKQFEIIHEANRAVRKQCLCLRDKYPTKYISNKLSHEDVVEALEDIRHLNELAMDANNLVYQYSYLVYNALIKFEENTGNNETSGGLALTYKETLHTWMHNHIIRIYQYARSIGSIPQIEVTEQKVLVDRMDKFVTDNTYYEIENLDKSIFYKHNSALLAIFTSINNRCLNDNDWILRRCCFEAAPSPYPYALLMYNNSIYIPPVITGEKHFNFIEEKLYLVGYKKKISTNFPSGNSSNYYECMYANISDFGFVSLVRDIDDIAKYRDSYLDIDINIDGISKFEKYGEMIRFCITEEAVVKNYYQNAKRLKDKLETEI